MVRKNQNSLLFLTTLGVYLGLLMVGGSVPQVFAHSATNRHFEITDEIEINDDLDNKPDGCDIGHLREEIVDLQTKFLWFNDKSLESYSSFVESILKAFPKKQFSSFDLAWTAVDGECPFRKVDFSGPRLSDSEVADELNSEFLFVANGFPGKEVFASVSRNNGETSFSFESKSFRYDTPLVRSLYSKALDYHRCVGSPRSAELIYKNTQVVVENNNLIISTRLARGSLDPLLVTNAK